MTTRHDEKKTGRMYVTRSERLLGSLEVGYQLFLEDIEISEGIDRTRVDQSRSSDRKKI